MAHRKKEGKGISLWTFLFTRYLAGFGIVFLLIFLILSLFMWIYVIREPAIRLEQMINTDEALMERQQVLLPREEVFQRRIAGEWDLDAEEGFAGPMSSGTDGFVCTGDGKVLEILHGDETKISDLLQLLIKEQALQGEGVRGLRLSGNLGTYTCSVRKDFLKEEAFLVYFIDTTAIMDFFKSTMVAMAFICLLGIALVTLIVQLVALSMKKKVDALSVYVERIGEGDFKATPPCFSIAEFEILSVETEKMAKRLEEAGLQQIAFFQNASHELRTPLMSIRCYAEGISYGVMEPKESSDTILAETEKLSMLVEDILYLSRLGGQMPLKREWLDLRDIFSACVTSFRRVAEEQGIRFTFGFDEEPVLFCCQAEDVERLCSNLISNAIRYTRTCIVLECEKRGEEILLAVEDDGEGISEEEMPHIFDRFYKGHGGVHGIGLSIVQSVAEKYGARVTVANKSGARFEIWFPAGDEERGET